MSPSLSPQREELPYSHPTTPAIDCSRCKLSSKHSKFYKVPIDLKISVQGADAIAKGTHRGLPPPSTPVCLTILPDKNDNAYFLSASRNLADRRPDDEPSSMQSSHLSFLVLFFTNDRASARSGSGLELEVTNDFWKA